MTLRDLTPWREKDPWPAWGRDTPLFPMRRELDSLFQDLWAGGGSRAPDFDRVFPRVNLSENPEAFRVTAELPGMDEKDVQVAFEGNLLVVSGSKCDEKEEKGREWYRRERVSGEFHRAVELPAAIDPAKATATFAKGVLTVDIAKRPDSRTSRRTIEVKAVP